MSDVVGETARAGTEAPVLQRLSTLDRLLPVWIVAAMVTGLLLGRLVPGLDDAVGGRGRRREPADRRRTAADDVPGAGRGAVLRARPGDRRLLVASLVLNWLVGPAVMFALAWLLLPDLPEYRTGLVVVGLARCIAMVLIWNDLSCGDREAAAVPVAVNSVFQIVAFGALGWFYLQLLPGWLGLPTTSAEFSVWAIVGSVLVFLGIPLLAGFLTRTLGERARGRTWYEDRFLPRVGPVALHGLLFTIVVLFELAIAVAIGTFGVTSGQALAGVVGPLIEVPVLVALVYVSLWATRWFPGDPTVPTALRSAR
ncbi:arsenic resistance protein [Geodermatophilus maliterrae]|uniref:arsenic resistance protein n=1 Tax=Geodermatophilus maliterrae TaxID=3162531 RepID=UPI003F699D09